MKMKEKDCTKKTVERKTVCVTVRLSPSEKAWLSEKRLSPTRIFVTAMKELGYKGDGK